MRPDGTMTDPPPLALRRIASFANRFRVVSADPVDMPSQANRNRVASPGKPVQALARLGRSPQTPPAYISRVGA
jgi:hypothetical protein